jgi:hypothetical protein
VRLQGERAIETLQRAFMFTAASQQHGAVVMCGRQVRVKRNGALETLQGVALAPNRLECDTQVRMCSRVLKCQTHRLAGVRECFFPATQSGIYGGAGAIPTGERSIQSKSTIAGLQRLFFTPERVQRLGEIQ